MSQFIPFRSFYEKFVISNGNIFFHRENLKRSGDTTFDYILVFTNIVVSYFKNLIILCIDYKRKNNKQLNLFSIAIARYHVAYNLLIYGITKLFSGQFPSKSVYRLDEQIDDMTSMEVVWILWEHRPAMANIILLFY